MGGCKKCEGVLYRGAESRVGEVLKTWLGERRFMEVEIENIKVAIKLKISPRKKRD